MKSSFLQGSLESVPEVAAKLKEPNTQDRKFEDVVKAAEQAAVLVLVYQPRRSLQFCARLICRRSASTAAR